jgi:hypothetical protein
MIGRQPLDLLAGVSAAAIAVMQQRVRLAAAPDRHHQGVGDELRRHRWVHRPADQPSTSAILKAHGSEAAMKTLTACCASASPKA